MKLLQPLTPRRVKLIGVSLVAAFVLLHLTFRTLTFYHQLQIQRLLSVMRSVHPDQERPALESELLRAGFRLDSSEPCRGDGKRYTANIRNNDNAGRWGFIYGDPTGFKVARFFGHRLLLFDARVCVRGNRAVVVAYMFGVTNRPGYQGELLIDVKNREVFEIAPQIALNRSPEYFVWPYFKHPETWIDVGYTSKATAEQRQHVFDLRFGCLYSPWECDGVKAIAPSMWRDYVELRKPRPVTSPSRCGDEDLYRAGRDANRIAIVKLTRIHSDREWWGDEQMGFVDLKFIRALRDKPFTREEPPLATTDFSRVPYATNAPAAFSQKQIDTEFFYFEGSARRLDGICDFLEATPERILTIGNVMAEYKTYWDNR
jgi:hypothetical protein